VIRTKLSQGGRVKGPHPLHPHVPKKWEWEGKGQKFSSTVIHDPTHSSPAHPDSDPPTTRPATPGQCNWFCIRLLLLSISLNLSLCFLEHLSFSITATIDMKYQLSMILRIKTFIRTGLVRIVLVPVCSFETVHYQLMSVFWHFFYILECLSRSFSSFDPLVVFLLQGIANIVVTGPRSERGICLWLRE